MTHENMVGADRQFTQLISSRSGYLISFLALPIIFFFSGTGYKAVVDQSMVGCAYLSLRRQSGFAFNVGVRLPHRRLGLGYALMEHIERVAKNRRRRWMALQVDNGNHPAQSLYARLGYSPYHPNYYVGEANNLRRSREQDTVQIEHLSQYYGSRLFSQYIEIERSAGDGWASEIIPECIPQSPVSGSYWRCLSGKNVIGCLRIDRKSDKLKLYLALNPDYWGDDKILELVVMALETAQESPAQVEIHLGSSLHHDKAGLLLNGLGFDTRAQSRILMLKRLGEPVP
jgi:N-acetylglutamate synthase-like GNAT family acetyltransferase